MLKETASQDFTRESLQQSGFEGFHHLYERRQEQFGQIPEGPGVYIILRENREPVKFLTSDADLAERWVADAQVIFIGHAENLRERVSGVALKSAGRNGRNWSGQVVWQVSDTENLTVSWRSSSSAEEANADRRQLLDSFVDHYGRPPFGNRRRSR